MAKKLSLIFGTLIVLIGVLVVYRQYLGVDLQPTQPGSGDAPQIQPGRQTIGGVRVGSVDDVFIPVIHPETGRRQAVYRCASWKVDEVTGEYILSEPVIELYLPSGQTIYISARKASLVVDEAGDRLVPRRGTLNEDVQIDIDLNRGREDQKKPRDQRQGDFIKIRTDEMSFNNDLQELRAPGLVTVDGVDVHISGTELLLQWDSAPDAELRMLRLKKGDRMRVNTRSALLRGGSRAGGDSAPAAATAAPTVPAEDDGEQAPVLSAYSVVLEDNVNVTVGSRSMQGCDRVKLLFSTQDQGGLDRAGAGNTAAATRPATTQAAPDVARATTEPADQGEMVVITWTGQLVMLPFDAAKEGRDAPAADQFELDATGKDLKLIEADPDGDMIARCGRLVYDSASQTTRLFAPEIEDGRVELTLANGDRAVSESMWIQRAEDQLVVNMDGAGSMTFDAAQQGVSVAPVVALPDSTQTQPAAAGQGDPDEPRVGRITWTESVRLVCAPSAAKRDRFIPEKATFRGEVVFAPGDGSSMSAEAMTAFFEPPTAATSRPAEGGRYAMPEIDRVEAAGTVKLQFAADGDNVTADALVIQMDTSEEGEVYPTQAHATGTVVASFDGSTIATDSLTVHFEPSADPSGRRAEPTYLTATGHVVLTDTTTDRAVRATGTALTCDLVLDSYEISGAPAKLVYGDEWLSGPKIVLGIEETLAEGQDTPTRRLTDATVVGEGVAQILLSRDLSGAALAEPTPGVIRWGKQMHYAPDENTLTFSGAVAFDSATDLEASADGPPPVESVGDHLRCDTLTLTLDTEDQEGAATQPADEAGSMMDTQRKVKSILAIGDVRLLSRRHDEDGFLISRLQVTGDHLDWDAVGSEITVDGPGTLSLEDYRTPAPKTAPTDDAFGSGGMEHPGITAFQWTDRMNLIQALWQPPVEGQAVRPKVWTATMEGAVMMRHRSGGKILGVDKLPIRLPDPMPVGRVTDLDCSRLLARFEAADNGSQAPGDGASPAAANMTLTLFEAIGDVVFRDGPYEAQGGRVVYDREEQVAVVYGSESADRDNPTPADDPTPAIVTYEDPNGTGGFDTVAPAITVLRVGNTYRMIALKAAGAGSR